MGATFSIGGVSFAAMGTTDGRKALFCQIGARTYQLIRFHVPGPNGNLIVRGGATGRSIQCKMRYIGTYPGIWSTVKSDQEAWENTAVTIVDEAGASYTNCNLMSMSPVQSARSMGRGDGKGFVDVIATFTQD